MSFSLGMNTIITLFLLTFQKPGIAAGQPLTASVGLDSLLSKYVSATGRVDYKSLKINRLELDSVVAKMEVGPPADTASKNEKLAFWMNAYNVFTLKLVVDNYPLKRITDLDGGKTWDVRRIEIGGKKYSLNDIENVILRPRFKDARIHFGINCAAKSCPPLHNQAFSAENVQSLLTVRTRKFIRSSANELAENQVTVSKVFDWYAADFGSLVEFLNRYSKVKIAADAAVSFKDYDWSLNE